MSVSMNSKAVTATPRATSASAWAKLGAFFAMNRQRRQLRDLDDHMLADIGITREEALKESRQITWDAPNGWRG